MVFRPIVYNAATGETVDPNNQSFYAGGQQRVPHPYLDQLKGAGVAFGAMGAAGTGAYFLQKSGLPVGNAILGAVRRIEEYSPGQVLRTFQFGNVLSQFSNASRENRSISAQMVQEMADRKDRWLTELLSRVEGYDKKSAILKHGITFQDGSLLAGNETIFKHAGMVRTVGQPRFVIGYSRAHSGAPIPLEHGYPSSSYTASFLKDVDFQDASGTAKKEAFYIMGAETRAGLALGQVRGYAAETVDRFNRLALAPIEMAPLKNIYEGINNFSRKNLGFGLSLGVKPGAALPTLGNIAKKWGIGLTATLVGYQTLDWAVRQSPTFDGTILDQGVSAGIATVGVKAQIAAAGIADAIPGVREYQDFQERSAPGSTSLHKLAAFPILGSLAGSIVAYADHSIRRRNLTNKFLETAGTVDYNHAARLAAEELSLETKRWGTNLASRLGQEFQKTRIGSRVNKLVGGLTPTKWNAILGLGVGLGLALPFIPGALIPEKRQDELRRIYSGEDLIAVKKGRWWEFGRQPYEGTKVDYFRPHWYPLMISRAREQGIWGEDEDKTSPLGKWFKKEFTYDWEREHYSDRPYPITGTFGEDIPIVGPLVAATIGKLIKPPKLMHTDEWSPDGELQEQTSRVLRHPPREGEQYNLGMGEVLPGTPSNPYTTTKLFGEQAYRIQEMVGLVGFAFGATKQAITGSEGFADQEEVLQSSRRAFGAERTYWDMDIGGGAGSTELLRRLFPHRRREIPEYNPIRNTMPDWLPGPGEKSPDFLHGDPYLAVKMGEIRLPGAGYEALHPELKGIDPADYPLMNKYSILADVAPYAEQTSFIGAQVKSAIKRGELTPEDEIAFKSIAEKQTERKQSKEFFEYQFLSDDQDFEIPGATQSKDALTVLNNRLAAKQQNPGIMSKMFGSYWESIVKAAYSPFEFITPLAPAHKLIGLRSAVESYKDTMVYGTEAAFWQHPVDQFVKPFANTFGSFLGWKGKPAEVEQKRDIEEYFDIMQYVKMKRLEDESLENNNLRDAAEYGQKSRETLTGLNPFTFNYSNIYRALPRSERDYFKAFSAVKTKEEREEILELVPDDEKRLYQGRWALNYIQELKKTVDSIKNPVDEDTRASLMVEIQKQQDELARAEGFPVTKELWERYLDEQEGGETYADWYRRAVLIPEKLEGTGIPGPDWVGWQPGVDLNDIKLKVVENLGLDTYTFDLWRDDVRRAAHKDFLDQPEVLEEMMENPDSKSPQELQAEIRELLSDMNLPETSVIVTGVSAAEESFTIHIDVSEDRKKELRSKIRDL